MPILKLSVGNWGCLNCFLTVKQKKKAINTNEETFFFLLLNIILGCFTTRQLISAEIQDYKRPETLTTELIGKHEELSYHTKSNFNKSLH